nr:co-chaperone DjlA [Methylomarinum sp. Ch1-1]MDP4522212.1 co-chaperone DjlA [Methylomarinum sp. Ch1-1]
MGHLAKVDGRVSEAEISLARRVMDEMRLSGDMREAAINLFQQGKKADFPLQAALTQFRKECHRRTNLIRMFMEIQVQAAYADGVLNRSEEMVLQNICAHLGISRFEYESIKLQFQAQQRFYRQSQQYPGRASRNRLHDAYAVLGIDSSASDGEVKKAYRRLMGQHHPDKLVAKGLPEEMMTLAKEKTQQVRKAYETIRESRGL